MTTRRLKPTAKTEPSELDPTTEERLAGIWKLAYGARTKQDLERLYATWAETYDLDHAEIGFVGHRRAADVLARYLTRRDVARVLDAGAGTGAAGQALWDLGFRDLTAVDLSQAMLARARAKGVYKDARVADISLPLDAFGEASFDAAILVGVFSFGQAPAETLDEIVRVVRPGGVIAFTARTDFWEQDAMGVRSRAEALARQGAWAELEVTDPLPYLPKKDPDALFRVWCFRVTGETTDDAEDGFEDAVREAFAADDWVKKLDHAWIWDSTASRLYNRYTQTKGYYLTDCEEEILRGNAAEIAGDEPLVVELGCGSARKIKHLLQAWVERQESVGYMPIDVSAGALRATAADVRRAFRDRVQIEPRQGLFEGVLDSIPEDQKKVLFFFGSSIGNLDSLEETVAFLERLRSRTREGDRLVLGIDLHKDEDVLERAYNEEECCRAFFAHMLRRINQHLGADFDPRVFELSSTYEEEPAFRGIRARRMNLRIAPREAQHTWVRELGIEVQLAPGQPVQVGISRKLEPDAIALLARQAGFRLSRQWFDGRAWFSVNELVPEPARDR